jgi:hypothetical protein
MYKPIPTDIITVHMFEDNNYSPEDLFLVIGYQQVHQGEELIVLLDPNKVYVMTNSKNVHEIKDNVSIKDLLWSKETCDDS